MHALETKIAQVRGRVRRLVGLHALSWMVAAVLTAVLALCIADYWIHFEDRGIRAICSLGLVAVAAWSVYRFLLPAVMTRLGDVQLAMRIERRFPGLNDRLASTMQFLREPEDAPQAGSAALRRAVIVETTAEVEELDLAEVTRPRAAVRA